MAGGANQYRQRRQSGGGEGEERERESRVYVYECVCRAATGSFCMSVGGKWSKEYVSVVV